LNTDLELDHSFNFSESFYIYLGTKLATTK